MTKAAIVVGLALALGTAGFLLGRARVHRVPDLSAHAAVLDEAAKAAKLDPALLFAVVGAESGGDPDAVSHAGAIGLCQLMPETAAEEAERLGLGDVEDRLTEPALNARLGASYLVRLLERFHGDEVWALAAYNAGATHARRWQRRAPDVSSRAAVEREGFKETRGYVARVLRLRDEYAR